MEKIDLNYYSIVLKNYAVYKQSEIDNILQHALPFVDNFILHSWHFETILTDEFLKENNDIENYEEIKKLNEKYRNMCEEEIENRIKLNEC